MPSSSHIYSLERFAYIVLLDFLIWIFCLLMIVSSVIFSYPMFQYWCLWRVVFEEFLNIHSQSWPMKWGTASVCSQRCLSACLFHGSLCSRKPQTSWFLASRRALFDEEALPHPRVVSSSSVKVSGILEGVLTQRVKRRSSLPLSADPNSIAFKFSFAVSNFPPKFI